MELCINNKKWPKIVKPSITGLMVLLLYIAPSKAVSQVCNQSNLYIKEISKIKNISFSYVASVKQFMKLDTQKMFVNCKIARKKENDSQYIFYFYTKGHQNNYYYDGDIFYIVNDDSVKKIKAFKINWKRIKQQTAFVNFTPITDNGQLLRSFQKRAKKRIIKDDTMNCEIEYTENVRGGDLLIRKYSFAPSNIFPIEFTFISNALKDIQYLNYKLLESDTLNFSYEELKRVIQDSITERLSKGYTYIDNTTNEYKTNLREKLFDTGTIFPDFKYIINKGDSQNIYADKSDILILDFWYLRCAPCHLAFPKLNQLYLEYKERNVNVISINPLDNSINDSIMTSLTIQRNMLNFIIGFCTASLTEKLNLKSYPTLYILDRNKKILYGHVGYNDVDYVEKIRAVINSNIH